MLLIASTAAWLHPACSDGAVLTSRAIVADLNNENGLPRNRAPTYSRNTCDSVSLRRLTGARHNFH